MRLRSFTGRTMTEAMAEVREHLGPDAIIVSNQTLDNGQVSVTAAIEEPEPTFAAEPAITDAVDPAETLNETLALHGAPPRLVEKLIGASLVHDTQDPVLCCAGALDGIFSFLPLAERRTTRPLMLVGPPGAGKTVSVAKLATRAVLAKQKLRVVSTDTVRAGAIEQLAAFTRLLDVNLHRAETDRQLKTIVDSAPAGELVLIDSAGINPYSASDRAELTALVRASGAEPVLVIPAGGDVFDTIEMGAAFREIGCTRMLVTRLDMVHRLGSILAAADANRLAFSDIGTSPSIADGLSPLNPVALARFLMPDMAAKRPAAATASASSSQQKTRQALS